MQCFSRNLIEPRPDLDVFMVAPKGPGHTVRSEFLRGAGVLSLQPVALNPAYADHNSNLSAAAAIDRNLRKSLVPHLTAWDRHEGKALVIEPHIEEIKFIGGAARFWAGALAGSSAVTMRVGYRDAETGVVIASPAFYQHAKAMSGAWTVGGADNGMLLRIAGLITS